MSPVVVDYAFPPHPTPDALRAVGASGVSRYLSWLTASAAPKVITPAEYEQLAAAGLAVVLNWEYDEHDLINPGFDAAGAAREALRQAAALPCDFRVIYWSADFDVPASQWPTIRGRLRIINSIIGVQRTGLYGPWDALQWAHDDGVANWFWQCMSTGFSGGRNAALWPGAHLRQRRTVLIGGADCDINDIIQPDYGQHGGTMTDLDTTDPTFGNAKENIYTIDNVLLAIEALDADHPGAPWWLGKQFPRTNAFIAAILEIQANAAKAASAAGAPVTQDQVDAAVLKALADPTVIGALTTALGGKLDEILARLAAAGKALGA